MKRLIVFVFVVCAITMAQNNAVAENFKMGYISLGRIFEEYNKVIDSNKGIEKVKKELQGKVDEINKLREGFDTLSQEAKEERKNQMLDKQKEIRKQTVEVRKDEDRILREVLKDIEKVSIEVRKKKKLDYIVDDRLIIAGPKDMDLTEEVIKLLNDRYKK